MPLLGFEKVRNGKCNGNGGRDGSVIQSVNQSTHVLKTDICFMISGDRAEDEELYEGKSTRLKAHLHYV